eukprot:5438910-Prymnesium_polylepis.3
MYEQCVNVQTQALTSRHSHTAHVVAAAAERNSCAKCFVSARTLHCKMDAANGQDLLPAL